jgi:four helix bundle protein
MKYEDWLASVPPELTGDPLWRMEMYRLAVFAGDLAWHDATKLAGDRRTISLSDQLFRAIGSIGANIAEGYGRGSGKDQVRLWEYALGSAREARGWYYQARYLLTDEVASHRMRLLTQITRSLLAAIPVQRRRRIAEPAPEYDSAPPDLLDDPPLP